MILYLPKMFSYIESICEKMKQVLSHSSSYQFLYRLVICGEICSTSSLSYRHITIGDELLKKGANHALGGSANLYFPGKIAESWMIVVASLDSASHHAFVAKKAKFAPHAVDVEDCAYTPDQ